MAQRQMTGVPANKVDETVNRFKADGATDVKTKKEADGSFTITATFAD